MAIDEDERMVEELLMPSSPVSAPQSFSTGAQPTSPTQNHLSSYFPVSSEPSASSTSVFASTDPFYLAAMQQQQQQQQSAFFAQNGRLGQSSPFFVRPGSTQHQHQHRENHHHPLAIDTSHSIFASTAY
jgi:hypothetical protein